jgi:hypothetical protein
VVGATAAAALGGAGKFAKAAYKAVPLPGFIKAPALLAGGIYAAHRGIKAINQRTATRAAQQLTETAQDVVKPGMLGKIKNQFTQHPVRSGLITAGVVGAGIWGASKLMGGQKPEDQSPKYGDNTQTNDQNTQQTTTQTETSQTQSSTVNNAVNEALTPKEHREAARSAFESDKTNTTLTKAFESATGGKKIKEIAGRQAGTIGGTALMQTEDGGIYSSGITKDGKVAFAAKGAVEQEVKNGASFKDAWKKQSGIALQFTDKAGQNKANIALSGAVAASNVDNLSTQLKGKQKTLNANVSKSLNENGYVFASSTGSNYGVLSMSNGKTDVTLTIGQNGEVQVFSATGGQGQDGLRASDSGLSQDVATQGTVTVENVDQFLEILGRKGFKMNNISKSMDITDQPPATETPTE